MKIIREKSSNEIIYACEHLTLEECGITGDCFCASNIKPEFYELIEGVLAPADFAGRHYTWTESTGWVRTPAGEAALIQAGLDAIAARKAELAAFRYCKETCGITINGTTILTDRESQATISCAYNSCQINPDMTINFKCSNGWITAESSEIEFIAYTVSNYVQKCFSREKELSDALEEDIDTDITTGWPNNEEESAMVDLVVDYKNLLKLRVKKLQATGEDADAVAALMLIYERNL